MTVCGYDGWLPVCVSVCACVVVRLCVCVCLVWLVCVLLLVHVLTYVAIDPPQDCTLCVYFRAGCNGTHSAANKGLLGFLGLPQVL